MNTRDLLEDFSAFSADVLERLEEGRPRARRPSDLRTELEREAIDAAARGFALWSRLRALDAIAAAKGWEKPGSGRSRG